LLYSLTHQLSMAFWHPDQYLLDCLRHFDLPQSICHTSTTTVWQIMTFWTPLFNLQYFCHQLPTGQQQIDWAMVFHFQHPIYHMFFTVQTRLDSLSQTWLPVTAFQNQFLNCHTLVQDSCLSFYGIAAPQDTASLILILVQQAILWFKQVAVIHAKTILLEDWRSTPNHCPCIWTIRIVLTMVWSPNMSLTHKWTKDAFCHIVTVCSRRLWIVPLSES